MESGDVNNVDDQAGRSRRELTKIPKPSMHLSTQDGEKKSILTNAMGENRKTEPTGHLSDVRLRKPLVKV